MKFKNVCVMLFSIMAFVSCKKEEEKVDTIETNTVKTETVIVKDTVQITDEKKTSVKLNSDGVEVEIKK